MNEIKIVIEGLKELTDAINRLAALSANENPVTAPVQTGVGTSGLQNTQMPVQPPYINPPMQQAPAVQTAPVSVPVPPVQVPVAGMGQLPGTVPTTAAVQAFTLEQLQVAAAGLTGAGKMPQVMGILQAFGIQAITELPKERYNDFAAALREAGAQI